MVILGRTVEEDIVPVLTESKGRVNPFYLELSRFGWLRGSLGERVPLCHNERRNNL